MKASGLRCQGTPPDGFLAFQARRLATGLSWAVFGIGGLALTLTWFHWLNFSEKDPERRVLRARRTISSSFRLFLAFMRAIGVADIDASALRSLREKKGAVIASNHPTLLDYVFVASELPEVDCVVKAELSRNFFLKGVVKAAGYMLNSENPADLIEDARSRLARGHCILIFPEGTRTKPGVRMKLRRGAAQVALRTGAEAELIHIKCSDEWLTKGAPWHRIPPGRPVIRIERAGALSPAEFWDGREETLPAAARAMTARLSESLVETP